MPDLTPDTLGGSHAKQRKILRQAVADTAAASQDALRALPVDCKSDVRAGTYTKARQAARLDHFFLLRELWFEAQDHLIAFEAAITALPRSPSKRFAILKRDGYRCQLCGASGQDARLEVDHKHPRSKGGSDAFSNLWTLCVACNQGKGVHSLGEVPYG